MWYSEIMTVTWVIPLPYDPQFYRPLVKKDVESNVEKGENVGIHHFLIYPLSFLNFFKKKKNLYRSHIYFVISTGTRVKEIFWK